MKYITASVAVAPVRKEPDHRSEMTTQLLMGEAAEVIESGKQFTRIRCLYDDYEGWIANNQLVEADPAGEPTSAAGALNDIRSIALEYLDTSYLWGGKSKCGIDCSGFSQQVYKRIGLRLPRDAYQQAALGEVIGFLQEVQEGDLAFFDNEEGTITHVGIMLGPEEIIHSSGKVRIDRIDNQGIINSETGARTHRLRIIKRYKKT